MLTYSQIGQIAALQFKKATHAIEQKLANVDYPCICDIVIMWGLFCVANQMV